MSRCFPYPPLGYSGNKASNESLIESIKRQRESEEAKAKRKKEKKREKKEREKKEKEKENLNGVGHDAKAYKGEKSWMDLERGYNQRKKEDEAEQLERSGITEEHEQPVYSQSPCYSSDSTQNCNKRRRHTSVSNGSNGRGNIIRIRLPVQKHKEPDFSIEPPDFSIGKEWLCPTSGRTYLPVKEPDLSAGKEQPSSCLNADLLAQHRYQNDSGSSQEELCSTSQGRVIGVQWFRLRSDKELTRSTSRRTGFSGTDDIQRTSGSASLENEMERLESLHKDLIEDWVPPASENVQPDIDDQEWLFERKQQDRLGEKRFKASCDVLCCSSPTLWPHAQFLPEADIYALPFIVPF